jgi:hypothetical protein
MDAANAFLPAFIDDYNRRFGKLPRDRHDAHRPVRKDEDRFASSRSARWRLKP